MRKMNPVMLFSKLAYFDLYLLRGHCCFQTSDGCLELSVGCKCGFGYMLCFNCR